jgi:hypothetical protein
MNIQEIRQKYPQYSDLSDEQLGKALHSKFYSDMKYEEFASKAGIKPSVSTAIAGDAISQGAKDTTVNPYIKAGAETLTGMTGVLRGAANIAGKPFVSEGQKPLGEQVWPSAGEADSGFRMAGSFADPLAWAIGGGVSKAAGQVLQSLAHSSPAMQQLAQKLAANWMARAGGRAVEGAAAGGAIGGLSDQGDAGTGALLGAGINAALPPVFSGLAKGARAIKDKAFPTPGALAVKAAGEKTDDVITALMKSKSGVPGLELTPGQASVPANSAEFAALQKLVATKDPSRFAGPAGSPSVQGQQEAARQAVVGEIARTPEALHAAIAKRASEGNKNYGEAFEQVVKRDKELRELWKNPYFKDEIGEAWKIAKASGRVPLKENMTAFLHSVKEGLDARIQTANNPNAPAISRSAQNAMLDAKEKLVGWLGSRNPLYDEARLAHRELSKPINQMKVGQEIEQALVAPVSGAERASSFGSALRRAENKMSKATGKPRIEDLTLTQQKALQAIEDNLKMDADFKKLAGAGMKNLEERIGAPQAPPTGFFEPIVSAGRSWLNKILGTGHEEALKRLAPLMEKNPQAFAQLMRQATPQQREAVNNVLGELVSRGAIAGAAQQ